MNRTCIVLCCLLGVAAAQEEPVKHKTESGLEYQVLKEGRAGTQPKANDRVKLHVKSWLEDRTVLDDTRALGKPVVVTVGTVMRGMDEGLKLMTVGSKYRFLIPWKLGFGERGQPPRIPAKANLVFEIELISVAKGAPLPVWHDANPEKQKTTESGLKYEPLEQGQGEAPKADQILQVRFALWNTKGELVLCTETSKRWLGGTPETMRLGVTREKFLAEAVPMLKIGSRYRFEVPAGLCWGARAVAPQLPANSDTVWELELERIVELPVFSRSDPKKAKTTDSGLMYEVLREGTGKAPGASDSVRVYYTGWQESGKEFDSAHRRGSPSIFRVGGVIKGWIEGLQLMKEGAVFRFTIPGKLAYGDNPPRGAPAGTLIFLVELLRVE